jgi:cobalt-precorrin-7 (C5)-methyltransferase
VVVDAHGKDNRTAIDETLAESDRGRIPFILADPGFDLMALGSAFLPVHPSCKIVTFEDLGYLTEVISVGTPDHPPRPSSKLFSVIVVRV